jgi:hypothetical protein
VHPAAARSPVPPPTPSWSIAHTRRVCWRTSSRPRPLKDPHIPSHAHTFPLSHTLPLERMSGAGPRALDVGAAGKAAPQKITPQRPRLPLPDGESGCPEGWPRGTRLAEKRASIAELSSRSRYEPPKATPMATPVVSASLSALGELPVKQIINHHQPLVTALVVVLVVALVVARHRSYQPVPRHPQAPS